MALIEDIKKRFSPMVFTRETINEETIQTLLEAARWSASSFNEQPWRFIVGKHPDDDIYKKIHSSLIEYNQDWAITAPVLMIALAKKYFSNLPDTLNAHAWYDTGMAVSSMVIQGVSMGIQAHQMGGFDSAKAREALAISDDYDIIAVIAVGHAGDPNILPEMYRERARQPRGRKEISEILL